MHTGTTLTQFIIEEQRRTAGATGDFTSLLNDVVTACKAISNVVNKGALLGVMGSLDSENVQGETQKKLDVITPLLSETASAKTKSASQPHFSLKIDDELLPG